MQWKRYKRNYSPVIPYVRNRAYQVGEKKYCLKVSATMTDPTKCYHRIVDFGRYPSGGHLAQSPSSSRSHLRQSQLHRTMSRQLLRISKKGDFTISLVLGTLAFFCVCVTLFHSAVGPHFPQSSFQYLSIHRSPSD